MIEPYEDTKPYRNAAEAINDLPPSVRIGPHIFAFRSVEQMKPKTAWGYTSYQQQYIELKRDLPHIRDAAEVVLHELLHAIHYVYSIKPKDKLERRVTTEAVALTALFIDNPWLHKWLSQCCSQI